ncbi:MAG: SPOR domain-containing protein [Candidatus Kryptoniota bacterium]
MGNLNFQDDESSGLGESHQDMSDAGSEQPFKKSPPDNSKLLWFTLLIVVIAIVAGGVYLLNKKGLLGPEKKAPAAAPAVEPPSPQPHPSPFSSGSSRIESPERGLATNAAGTAQRFAVQISSFKSERIARKYLGKMKSKGINGYIVRGKVGKTTWYRVWVGPFENEAKAILASGELRRKVGTNVWVIPAE